MLHRKLIVTLVLLPAIGIAGCRDVPTSPIAPSSAAVAAAAPTPMTTSGSLRWNAVARNYVAGLAAKPNQQAALRAFTYLALAQWRAVGKGREDGDRAGQAGAIAGASVAVLSYIFPSGAAAFEAEAQAEAAATGFSSNSLNTSLRGLPKSASMTALALANPNGGIRSWSERS